ncbi:MAG: hypothetical protein ACE10D_13370, partial [Planctomycetota bacterium]
MKVVLERALISLILLFGAGAASASGAEETAADLYQRAAWAEQALNKPADAEKLYQRILQEHADAPEAPRALLGLIRIRSARGEDVSELSKLIETRYPKAKAPGAEAKRIAGAAGEDFNPTILETDSPLEARIKELYIEIATTKPDPALLDALADLGPVAHPMLTYALRSTSPGAVKAAAKALLLQRTDKARSIVETALRDPQVPFRAQVLAGISDEEMHYPPSMVVTLTEIYGSAAPRLREVIVWELWEALGAGQKQPERERIFQVLARALQDEDPQIQQAASYFRTWTHYAKFTDVYAAALVKQAEAAVQGEPVKLDTDAWYALPTLAMRP